MDKSNHFSLWETVKSFIEVLWTQGCNRWSNHVTNNEKQFPCQVKFGFDEGLGHTLAFCELSGSSNAVKTVCLPPRGEKNLEFMSRNIVILLFQGVSLGNSPSVASDGS